MKVFISRVGILPRAHPGRNERPIAITVICILGFIGAGLSVPMVFSDIATQIGSWFPPYSGSVAVIGLFCMAGLWFVKRWAIYTYTSLVLVNQIVLTIMDRWNILVFIMQGIVVAIILLTLEPKVKSLSIQFVKYVRRQIWAITVAYMIGIHNFYKQENKSPEDIVLTIEDDQEQEEGAPKD